jgi:hypothetical protein
MQRVVENKMIFLSNAIVNAIATRINKRTKKTTTLQETIGLYLGVPKVRWVIRGRRGHLVRQGHPARQVGLVLMDMMVWTASQDHRGRRALQALRGRLEKTVIQEPQARKAHRGKMALQVLQEPQAQQAQQVLRVHRGHPQFYNHFSILTL